MKYRHYKGGIYTVIGYAKLTEEKDAEPQVIYQNESGLYARPASMFHEEIEVDGIKVKRFEEFKESSSRSDIEKKAQQSVIIRTALKLEKAGVLTYQEALEQMVLQLSEEVSDQQHKMEDQRNQFLELQMRYGNLKTDLYLGGGD